MFLTSLRLLRTVSLRQASPSWCRSLPIAAISSSSALFDIRNDRFYGGKPTPPRGKATTSIIPPRAESANGDDGEEEEREVDEGEEVNDEDLMSVKQGLQLFLVGKNNDELSTELYFTDFIEAVAFMNHAALSMSKIGYEPDWSNAGTCVVIRLSTPDKSRFTYHDVQAAYDLEDLIQRNYKHVMKEAKLRKASRSRIAPPVRNKRDEAKEMKMNATMNPFKQQITKAAAAAMAGQTGKSRSSTMGDSKQTSASSSNGEEEMENDMPSLEDAEDDDLSDVSDASDASDFDLSDLNESDLDEKDIENAIHKLTKQEEMLNAKANYGEADADEGDFDPVEGARDGIPGEYIKQLIKEAESGKLPIPMDEDVKELIREHVRNTNRASSPK